MELVLLGIALMILAFVCLPYLGSRMQDEPEYSDEDVPTKQSDEVYSRPLYGIERFPGGPERS